MNSFKYTAWFRDTTLHPEDEDYEWPACIVIEASNAQKAKEWGDHLAKRYSNANTHESLLHSEAEPIENNIEAMQQAVPLVPYGYDATDEEIGW